jgi:hypothetical protein
MNRSTAKRQAEKNLKRYRDVLLNRQNEVKNADKKKEEYGLFNDSKTIEKTG